MARLTRRQSAAVRRSVYGLVLLLGGLLLLPLFSRQPAAGSSSTGAVVSDQATAAKLFELARHVEGLEEFTAELKKAGLMADGGAGRAAATQTKGKGKGKAAAGSEDAEDGSSSQAAGETEVDDNSSTSDSSQTDKGGSSGQLYVPPLSRELAHEHARDGIVIVTWANYHFYDFVLNWVHHMRVHGISNYMVGAMDVEIGQALASQGYNVFAMYDVTAGKNDTGLGTADFGWGSPTFHKMGRQKVDLARTFTDYGLDLCLCDVDTVWINDPTEYFEKLPEAHILASSDELDPTNDQRDEGLEQPHAIHSAMNIGLLFFRHGKNTTLFIDEWQRRLEADKKSWDQNVFNAVAYDGLLPFKPAKSNSRLVWAANQSVVVGVLPVASFASGHTFFVQRLFEYQQIKPYVVHTTFQYGGTSGKRHRLREAMLWVDPPSYYSEGLFLSVDLKYPETPTGFQIQTEFMMEGHRFKTDWVDNDMIDFHLKAIRGQILQLRTALQLAVALNRTIVMPKLLSWCDRYWGPVEFCQIPGAFKTRLPFVAPMDHILEPFHFDSVPENNGPPIRFREYSFLANERTPAAVKESKLVVTPSANTKAAKLGKGKDGKQVLQIPTGLTDGQLRKLFADYTDTKVLHFSSVEGALGGYDDPADRELFQRRMMSMMGFFCCKRVKEGEDGGYGYARFIEDAKP